MTRHYAYALSGNRAVDSAPLCKPKNTTILSSIQANRIYHYTTFPSGTTVARFKDYLENDLIPYLSKTSVLVMDNMKSHHAKAVKELLDKSGIHCLYLPPYSPDLNPIEKLWSKVKAILRNSKHGQPMLCRMPSRLLLRIFRNPTVPDGFVLATTRFNFENCYNTKKVQQSQTATLFVWLLHPKKPCGSNFQNF